MKRSTARKSLLAYEYKLQQRSLVPGASVKEILEREAAKPMRAATMQRGVAYESLFGEASKQESLF